MIDALAYLDLGSGSLVAQLIIATIVAVPFFIRGQIRRFLAMVRVRLGALLGARNEPEVR